MVALFGAHELGSVTNHGLPVSLVVSYREGVRSPLGRCHHAGKPVLNCTTMSW